VGYFEVWINDYEFAVGNGDVVIVIEDIDPEDHRFIEALHQLKFHSEALILLVNHEGVLNSCYTQKEIVSIKRLLDPRYQIRLSTKLQYLAVDALIDTSHQSRPQTKITKDGFVYLIQSSTGFYKIGRTKNPDDRLRTFGIKLPFEVDYVCTIPTEDMIGLETQLHNQFRDRRINGEWFDLSKYDVEYIKSLAE
jgi:hypothetical protein